MKMTPQEKLMYVNHRKFRKRINQLIDQLKNSGDIVESEAIGYFPINIEETMKLLKHLKRILPYIQESLFYCAESNGIHAKGIDRIDKFIKKWAAK